MALAQESQPAVHLIPSGVLLHRYRPKLHRTTGPVCVGWIGNGAHYADDLIGILAAPLARVGRRHEVRFRIVGACGEARLYKTFGEIPGITIDFIDHIQWSNADAVADAIAPFDLGVFPLHPGPFNDYKCAFKALEYMASAVPVVASDVGTNAEIVKDGETGFICRCSADWERALESLASDGSLRKIFGEAGRARAEAHFTVPEIASRIEAVILSDVNRHAKLGLVRIWCR